MSLREEIHKECEKPMLDRKKGIQMFALVDDENGINDLEHSIIDDFIYIAIKAIEKRIDEMLKAPTENEIGVPGSFYISGFHDGLNQVKEMLK